MEKKEPPVSNLLEIDLFSQPPENVDKWTPLTYYRKFWSDDFTERLVDQTNLYNLPVVNNAEKEKEKNKDDRLLKVKPLPDAVRAKCLKIEPERIHSIDEQIIPGKTK